MPLKVNVSVGISIKHHTGSKSEFKEIKNSHTVHSPLHTYLTEIFIDLMEHKLGKIILIMSIFID